MHLRFSSLYQGSSTHSQNCTSNLIFVTVLPLQVRSHLFHARKVLVTSLAVVWQVLAMDYLLVLHQFLLRGKGRSAQLATYPLSEKSHLWASFCSSQHFLQIWPLMFQSDLGFILKKLILVPQMLQNSFFSLKSTSFASKHDLQSKPSISHCHRGSQRSVIFFSTPQIRHFCLYVPL